MWAFKNETLKQANPHLMIINHINFSIIITYVFFLHFCTWNISFNEEIMRHDGCEQTTIILKPNLYRLGALKISKLVKGQLRGKNPKKSIFFFYKQKQGLYLPDLHFLYSFLLFTMHRAYFFHRFNKNNFPLSFLDMKLPYEPVCPFVCWLVGWSVCHNFKFNIPYSYRSSCFT